MSSRASSAQEFLQIGDLALAATKLVNCSGRLSCGASPRSTPARFLYQPAPPVSGTLAGRVQCRVGHQALLPKFLIACSFALYTPNGTPDETTSSVYLLKRNSYRAVKAFERAQQSARTKAES